MMSRKFIVIAAILGLGVMFQTAIAEEMISRQERLSQRIPIDPIEVEYTYDLKIEMHKASRDLLPSDWNKVVRHVCSEAAKEFMAKKNEELAKEQITSAE